MKETPYERKLDSMGRIMIPAKLRDELHLILGATYHFTTLQEGGRNYICVDCGPIPGVSLEEAMQIVQAKGYKVVENDD